MKESDIIQYTCENRVGVITLNSPERHNALSTHMIHALQAAFTKALAEPRAKIILLRARGTSFCSGADLDDLKASQQNGFEDNLVQSNTLRALLSLIYHAQKPTVAQVQGAAIAGGCGLVSTLDFVLASETAMFSCPEVRIGFMPAIILSFLLHRMGEAHTKSLVLSGQAISAARAHEIGLVNSVHAPELLTQNTNAFIEKLIQKNSSHSMQLSKRLIYRLQHTSFEEGLQYAAEINASARGSEDCQLGVQRFLQKEPQNWSQR